MDYYDHWFDGWDAELIFERKSAGGMSRRNILEYLRALGFKVPVFGYPAEIYDVLKQKHSRLSEKAFNYIQDVVIHLDETTHCGEGKIMIRLCDAIKQYPNNLAVEYIPALPSGHGQTWRYLQVGNKIFWLMYTSQSDWRSNCGEVNIEVLSQEKDGHHPLIHNPLFAIDFVRGDALYAIDFNIAPGIKGTGIEEILSPQDVAKTIKGAKQLPEGSPLS